MVLSLAVSSTPTIDAAITVLWLVVGAIVVRMEFERRNGRQAQLASRVPTRASFAIRIICECAPEILGITICCTIAALLRVFGDNSLAPANMDAAIEPTWERIKREWPILGCGDTLHALASMARLVGFTSAALRLTGNVKTNAQHAASQFCTWPVFLMLAATAARVTLAASSDAYVFDGPLGGNLPTITESLSLAALGMLAQRAGRTGVIAAGGLTAAAVAVAQSNYLSLARDSKIDSLFMVPAMLELFGAFGYLGCTSVQMFQKGFTGARGNAAACLVNAAMTVQAGFLAYYWLHIRPSEMSIGAGHPICVQRIATLLQLGAFAGVTCLNAASLLDTADKPTALADDTANSPATSALDMHVHSV